MAFYTIFSIAPFLLIVTAVAGLFFGEGTAKGEIFNQMLSMLGAQGALAVQGLLEGATRPTGSVLAGAVGSAFLFIGATSVFAELQDALDRIWRASLRVNTFGLWRLVRARLLSFGMILGIGFLLMVSLAFSAGVAALSKWWDTLFHGWSTVAFIINLAVSLILSTAVFAMIYKLMPRVQIDWRDSLDRCGSYGTAVYHRQVSHRLIPRKKRDLFSLWVGRVARCGFIMGVLFRSGLLIWRGIHTCVLPQIRLAQRTTGKLRRFGILQHV